MGVAISAAHSLLLPQLLVEILYELPRRLVHAFVAVLLPIQREGRVRDPQRPHQRGPAEPRQHRRRLHHLPLVVQHLNYHIQVERAHDFVIRGLGRVNAREEVVEVVVQLVAAPALVGVEVGVIVREGGAVVAAELVLEWP
ncbi:hypothetical protein EUGRSUZ_F03068 [Eucalyptus grandis]|uniref:Uncharacterized protein n=2 Tax=Eucalyptus grandis TaxID=71139 RepID=A0ACC3KM87_EUCGR|nr:hypothetical protein EUGRSUZ_F03068 [Eucalyptus grandis]